MKGQEVVQAEVVEDGSVRPGRRITAGPVIAIVVVAILVLAGLVYMFYGNEVDSVRVLSIEDLASADGVYGIQAKLLVMTDGFRGIEGTGKLEILFHGDLMHSEDVGVDRDTIEVNVEFSKFVMANGNYTVRFSMQGKQDSIPFIAVHVPDALNISLTQTPSGNGLFMFFPHYTFEDPETSGAALSYFNRFYTVNTFVTDPSGSTKEDSRTLFDWTDRDTGSLIVINESLMGNYSVRAELENSLVKSTSPFRKVSCSPETAEIYLNKPPEIIEVTYPSRIAKGQQVEFTIRATDPDENGGLDYATINWDVNDVNNEFEIYEFTGTYVKVKHTFSQSRQYNVFVNVADNGYVDPDDLSINYKKFDDQEIQITVRLI